ncbi:MAG: zinc ribbon domain-containing protein, partial [Anaerolineae bacterium]|nr:zinc ribbon domain-containing protein [Anaerolineae bacterium]
MDTLQPVRDVLRSGDKTKAQEQLEKVIRISPSAEAYYLYALLGYDANTITTRLQMALQADPDYAPALQVQDRIEQLHNQGAADREVVQLVETILEKQYGVPKPAVQKSRPETNVYEMLWDCQFCGTKGNLGLTHRFCPNCGSPQNPDARYFPSDEEKVAVYDHKFVGVDVTCPNCGELNGAAAEFCGQCGTPLTEGAKKASTLASETVAAGQAFQSSGSRDLVKEQFDAEMQRIGVQSVAEKPKRGGFNPRTAAIIGIIVAAIGIFGFLFSRTEAVDVTVTGHTWERSISIQQYDNFTTRSWRDSPPAGDNVSIRLGSCSQEIRSYNQVPDGQECRRVRVDQGDGTFREQQQCETVYRCEPVYDDMCTWTGMRWDSIQPALGSGNSLAQSPAWPLIDLNECNSSALRAGCQRESGRSEDYIIIFDNEYRCSFSQAAWE